MRVLTLLTAVLAQSSVVAHVFAEIPQQTLPGYTMRLWQTQDGLPEQTVQAFAQTADGFLWIGTTGGLLRFDGARFKQFNRETDPVAFAENSVFTLTAAGDGNLWIGTDGGGLIRYDEKTFHHYGVEQGLTCGFVRTVKVDHRGVIWIGTDIGLFQLSNANAPIMKRVDAGNAGPSGVAPLDVHALFEDEQGRMWVGGSKLFAFDGTAKEYKLPGNYSENRVKSVVQTPDGSVWVGTVSGLSRMKAGENTFRRVDGIAGTVRVLRQMPDGRLWIGTIGNGAYAYDHGLLERVTPHSPLPSKAILSLFEDASNNIWMGTPAGMLRFSHTNVSLIPLAEPSDSDFETISRDSDGTLWIGSTHLFHIVKGKAIPYNFPQLDGARVRNVFRDRQGTLWIGTEGRGLFHLTAHGATEYTTANGLVNNFVRAIIQTRDGTLWVATDEGMSRIDEGVIRNFKMEDGLAYFSVRALAEDRAGDLWIGTDRGLSHMRRTLDRERGGEEFIQDDATRALRNEKVFAILAGKDGAIWFGTRNGGLYILRPEVPGRGGGLLSHLTTKDGLASDSVYSIVEDGWQRLWIGSPNGISRMNASEVEARANDRSVPVSQKFVTRADAGAITGLYGGIQPAAALTPDGEVWFPTLRGPVHIAVDDDTDEPAGPKVFIDQIIADGKVLPVGQSAVLDSANSNLEIAYAPLQLKSQEDLRFVYKLEPFDQDWRYASSRRVAYYTNLPAGRYIFRVRAFEATSPDRATETTIGIIKHQHFYLTYWFLALCSLAAAFVVWTIYRMHLRRMHQKFQAVIDERARLAREMHDTLIQGCNSVSALLEACSGTDDSDREQQLELIEYARIQLATSIDEARQAVWNLRTQESGNLGDALRRLAETIGHDSGVAVQCVVEGTPYAFHAQAMHEIMMVSREALFNALMHASPSQVTLRAVYGTDTLTLVIHDDGCGFQPNEVFKGHFGLIGIQERVRQLGGEVDIQSISREGTQVRVELPRERVVFQEVSP